MLWASLKEKLLYVLGGALAMAIAFWRLTRKPRRRPEIRIVPKVVPEDEDEMRQAAIREGIIK